MAEVVIFGLGDYAEQTYYYLTNDSPHTVIAFSATADRCDTKVLFGLPLIPFEDLCEHYPPEKYKVFAPMSGRAMNRLREQFYFEIKAKGYELISYVSSRALLCDNEIGDNCFILEGANIQPFAQIGSNVVIWCGTHVGHHTSIEDHTFISSNVNICGRSVIGHHSYLSSDAVIDSNVKLAEGTLVSINTAIKRNTEPWGIYTGDPAKRRKVSSKDFNFL